MFFPKINLVIARKIDFEDPFLAFESQDNIKIEYIWINMLMFLRNPIKKC